MQFTRVVMAALGSLTVSSRNSMRSASSTWSRRVRNSAMVPAVTTAQSFAGFISITQSLNQSVNQSFTK